MTKLSDYMKNNFDMKTFNHMPLQAIPEVHTESIKGKRFYVTPDGNKYPSITTVLSGRNAEGLIAWRERVGNDVANQIMRTAAKRGTAVHELEERYGLAINQIAILIVTEDGAIQTFVKDKKDYLPLLQPAIDDFWEKNKTLI
jgi:hypothetical protein